MSSKNKYYIKANSDKGVKIPLLLNGEATEDWLLVRGTDSDAYKQKLSKLRREILKTSNEASEEDSEMVSLLLEEKKTELLCACVAGWSFPEECNEENVRDFLVNAPQIADQVDTVAAQRHRFFTKELESCTNTQSKASNSTKNQRAVTSQKGST